MVTLGQARLGQAPHILLSNLTASNKADTKDLWKCSIPTNIADSVLINHDGLLWAPTLNFASPFLLLLNCLEI